jgi:hypothetical protein
MLKQKENINDKLEKEIKIWKDKVLFILKFRNFYEYSAWRSKSPTIWIRRINCHI